MKKTAPRGRHQRVRFGLVAVVALLGTLILGSSAMSADSKTYSAVFTSTVPGGENGQSMSLTIENLGTPQLGSANVTAPPGVLIQSVSGLNATSSFTPTSITLRDLNLASGPPLILTMSANISCPARNADWSITGRQNNNGTGSVFTLAQPPISNTKTQVTLACTLSITVEPNHAQVNAPIRDVAYGASPPTTIPPTPPTGNPVTVVARNNDPVPIGGAIPLAPSNDEVTLGKTAGFFTSGGTGFTGNKVALSNAAEAVFTALQSSRTGFAFQLTATATGYNGSAPSRSFDIQVAGTTCPGESCHVETPRGHTTNKVDGANTDNIDTLGVGLIEFDPNDPTLFQIPANVCSTGPFVPLPDSSGFTTSMQLGVTGGTTSQPDWTLAATLDKFIMNQIPLNGAAQIQGCLGANRISAATGLPIPCDGPSGGPGFPTAGGGVATCDPVTKAWWGLLPDAPPGVNECTDPLTNPVVLKRNKSGARPGDFTITICKPYPWDGGGGWR